MEEDFFDAEENIEEQLQQFLGNIPENFSILEEEVDVDKQMEYFEMTKKRQNSEGDFSFVEIENKIKDDEVSIDEKKQLLVELAGIETAEVLRFLEKLKTELKDTEIFDWIAMAYHENRMLIESDLLEQNPVFISTGMGGKGRKLRYFAVLISKNNDFSDSQEKLLKSELDYSAKNNNCELESVEVNGKYVLITLLIPIDSNIKNVFTAVIDECNLLGNFLDENFIVTNMKKLSIKEIEKFIEEGELGQE